MSIREQILKSLPFLRPFCPWKDSCGIVCAGELTCVGPRYSGRRGKYWEFRCRKCFRFSWSSDGRAHRSKQQRKVPRGRPDLLNAAQESMVVALRQQGKSYGQIVDILERKFPSLRDKVNYDTVLQIVRRRRRKPDMKKPVRNRTNLH